MDTAEQTFLTTQCLSVLSILQEEMTLHSATLHYAYDEEKNVFYFLTDKESRKCRPLGSGKRVAASVVIGFDEKHCATYQAEGLVSIAQEETELASGWEAYGRKYPERLRGRENPAVALLQFTPTWTRFTEMKSPKRFDKERENTNA